MKLTQKQFNALYKKTDSDNFTLSPSYVESAVINASLAENEASTSGPPARIHIHSIRKRLCDADGISGKAAIDGIVAAGILPDDSPKYVEEVSYSQEKGKEEKTIITITKEEQQKI